MCTLTWASKRWITMQVRPCVLRRPAARALSPGRSPWLVSCVRSHVCVGPRHYCWNRNPTPALIDLGTQLFLSLWLLGPSSASSPPTSPLLPPSSLPASPLLVLASPTRLADQTDTSAWRLLSTASSPRARAPVIITHQRPPTFPPPASRHRAS